MKAIVYTAYGSPDVLQLKEVEKPVPGAGDVLIEVHAASANPLDWHLMRADPLFVRLGSGLRRPKDPRLGADVAGRVAAVGQNVTQFQPGDEVFGSGLGSFAEYVSIPAHRLAFLPTGASFEEAAAIPVAAVTALQGLRDKGQLRPGQQVLIHGASGGVGTFAVQIARALGAEVSGVCSTQNMELVRSLGATHVIDYTREDFTRSGQRYDLIYDAVGNRSVAAYRRALKPHGVCVIAGFHSVLRLFEHMLLGPLRSTIGHKKIGLMGMANMSQSDLLYMKELLETGSVVPVVGRRYPLHEVSEALRYLEGGHACGKVVIVVQQHDNL